MDQDSQNFYFLKHLIVCLSQKKLIILTQSQFG